MLPGLQLNCLLSCAAVFVVVGRQSAANRCFCTLCVKTSACLPSGCFEAFRVSILIFKVAWAPHLTWKGIPLELHSGFAGSASGECGSIVPAWRPDVYGRRPVAPHAWDSAPL